MEVLGGPAKEMSRMREKLAEYAPPHLRGAWPLAANVLDPVRASVVTHCPSSMLQVVRWFVEAGAAGAAPTEGDGGKSMEAHWRGRGGGCRSAGSRTALRCRG